jgi:hypothetical protein
MFIISTVLSLTTCSPQNKKVMPPLTEDQLRHLTKDDITQSDSPLLREPFRIIESLPGESYEQKQLEALKHLPKKVGYYYLIFRLDVLWGNGGMQAVALDKDSETNAILLGRSIEAINFFGASSSHKLLQEIVPVAVEVAREIDALVLRDAPELEFEPLWARLDFYTDRYEDFFDEIYSKILKDIHSNPKDWQTDNN